MTVVGGGAVGIGFSLTLDKYDRVYLGPVISIDRSTTVFGGGFTSGYLNANRQADSLFSQWGVTGVLGFVGDIFGTLSPGNGVCPTIRFSLASDWYRRWILLED